MKKKNCNNVLLKNEAHTVYKHMGILMAEALGHRVDEIAPLAAVAAGAGRVLAGAGRVLATTARTGGRLFSKVAQKAGQAAKETAKETAKDIAIKTAKNKLNKLAGPEEREEE
jgi:hypothetical protein